MGHLLQFCDHINEHDAFVIKMNALYDFRNQGGRGKGPFLGEVYMGFQNQFYFQFHIPFLQTNDALIGSFVEFAARWNALLESGKVGGESCTGSMF